MVCTPNSTVVPQPPPSMPANPSPFHRPPVTVAPKPSSQPNLPVPVLDPARTITPSPITPNVSTTPKSPQSTPSNGGPSVPPISASQPPSDWGTIEDSPHPTSHSAPFNNTPRLKIDEAAIHFPDLNAVSAHEPGDGDVSTLRMESALARLGYSVRKGSIRTQRRLALQKGVNQLGLQNVINHLRWLIRFRRPNQNMQVAVACWIEDFEWLKSTHKN